MEDLTTPTDRLIEGLDKLRALLADPHPGLKSWNDAAEEASVKVEELITQSRGIADPDSAVAMMKSDSIKDKFTVLANTSAHATAQIFKHEGETEPYAVAFFVKGEPTVGLVMNALKRDLPGDWLE